MFRYNIECYCKDYLTTIESEKPISNRWDFVRWRSDKQNSDLLREPLASHHTEKGMRHNTATVNLLKEDDTEYICDIQFHGNVDNLVVTT